MTGRQTDRPTDRQDRAELRRHGGAERRRGETQRETQVGKNQSGTRNKGPAQLHPTDFHLQGRKGTRTPGWGVEGGAGVPPSGAAPHPAPELISGCHLHGEVLVKEI